MVRLAGLMLLLVSFAGNALFQTPRLVAEATAVEPVLLTNAHDGTYRKFIVEQDGQILVMQPGSTATHMRCG